MSEPLEVTEQEIDWIGDEVGYAPGGWDASNVPPEELIRAVIKTMLPKICRTTPGKCFCGVHLSEVMAEGVEKKCPVTGEGCGQI